MNDIHRHEWGFVVEDGPDCEECFYSATIAVVKCDCGAMMGPSQMEEKLNADLESEIAELREDYMELIYAVATKYPNETRHETALRYIQEHESGSDEPAQMPKEVADAANN